MALYRIDCHSTVTSSELVHRDPALGESVERVSPPLHSDPGLFAYYTRYILSQYNRQDWAWCIETLAFIVCIFISFLGLAWDGTSSSSTGDSHLLSIRKGALVSLHQRLCVHNKQHICTRLTVRLQLWYASLLPCLQTCPGTWLESQSVIAVS